MQAEIILPVTYGQISEDTGSGSEKLGFLHICHW